MLPDLKTLEALVRRVSEEELMPRFRHSASIYKGDGSVVTEADFAVQQRLIEGLAGLHPEALFLGEEMDEATQETLAKSRERDVWCVDPLDGTNNFAKGFPFFCISVALLRNAHPVLGLIYDPNRDELFLASKGGGAFLNDVRISPRVVTQPLPRAMAMIDFKRLPKGLARGMAERPPVGSWRYTGAGALEWSWLAAGRYDAYLHGGQKLWDFAAGALILAESGGAMETLDGEDLFSAGRLAQSVIAAPDRQFLALWRAAIEARRDG